MSIPNRQAGSTGQVLSRDGVSAFQQPRDVTVIHDASTFDAGSRAAEDAETRRREEQAKIAAAHAAAKLKAVAEEGEAEEEARPRRPGVITPKRPAPSRGRVEPRRRAGKITIAEALGDGEERVRSLAAYRQ